MEGLEGLEGLEGRYRSHAPAYRAGFRWPDFTPAPGQMTHSMAAFSRIDASDKCGGTV